MDNDLGKMVLMSDGHSRRVLRKDDKGFYIKQGGLKSYVKFHEPTQRYSNTGEWGHLK